MSKKSLKTNYNPHNGRNAQGENVGVVNLGCARNLVDSQVFLGRLKRGGHHIVNIEDSEVAIVNTCGFIEEAKRESIDAIIDLLELKKRGKLKKVSDGDACLGV